MATLETQYKEYLKTIDTPISFEEWLKLHSEKINKALEKLKVKK